MTQTTPAIETVPLAQGRPAPRQVALVSGLDVPLFQLELPAGLRGQAREQVARRQVADRFGLSEAQVTLRPIALPAGTSHWDKVLVTDARLAESWRQIPCRAVLPDYLALPTAPDLWVIDAGADRDQKSFVVRLAPGDGFACATPLLPAALTAALKLGRPKAIYTLCPPEAALVSWCEDNSLPLITSAKDLEPLALEQPRRFAHGELDGDLRQDPLAARARLAGQVLPWRWPLLLAALAALAWSATQIVETRNIQQQIAVQTQLTHDLVRQHFVPDAPLLDLRLQVSRALAEMHSTGNGAQAGPNPVDLLWQVTEVMRSTPGTSERLTYLPEAGLTLTVRLADFAAVEQLLASFEQVDLQASLRDSRAIEGDEGVRAEVQIRSREESP